MTLQTLIVERQEAVTLIRLNRPEALNALNGQLMDELTQVLDGTETDPSVRCVVITGSDRAFAAGADIKEMASKSYAEVFTEDFITRNWERVTRCRKPVIAAVAGYALGGGCELAMMCDFIIAADNAKFGQPEINLGV
ncbi:MAG TPA: enoyl-CoA hydratase-related protein, partial [Phenylobacterium sp.]|nr:enoyl-CoA hydratase-related protein [Phenylobacterium sp.]